MTTNLGASTCQPWFTPADNKTGGAAGKACSDPAVLAKTESGTGSIGEKAFHLKVAATLALAANNAMVAGVRENTKSFIGATRYQPDAATAGKISYSKTMQFESAIPASNSGSGSGSDAPDSAALLGAMGAALALVAVF